jgi:membrane protease YdiL (CAAX protease family)
LVALLSLWVAVKLFFRVFPEASIQFKVNRESSLPIAEVFLEGLRQKPADLPGGPDHSVIATLPADLKAYHHIAIFDYDENAKTFLERELGLEKANQIMGREVRLWRWKHRWFRPLQKEEFQVDISPAGELNRFQHLVPEDAPGANLAREEAQALAERFLRDTLHRDIGRLEFVEANTEKRQNRTDHLFRWKSKDFALGDADYRFTVGIQGSEIGEYDEYLKIPDEWSRGYQKLRSLNDTTATVDFIFLFLTILAMLIVLIRQVRRHDVRWRIALLFGLAAFVLTFLSRLNNLPLSVFTYSTTDSYGSFWGQLLLNALLAAGGSAAAIFFLVAAAEPVYRQAYGARIALSNLFRWRGLRSKEFFIGSIVGITLTFFFFAYDSIFYLVAQKLGAWAPADVPYSDLLNTRIPWAYVLFFGFFPAVSEEFISRMFSVPFFERVFRYRWLAIFLASFIWGFGHANYPNQPFYIRGIEVGVGGVIVSLIFLRFGIVAPLIWHYSVDALYTAFLLLRSQNLYLAVSGAVSAGIMLVPFAVALLAYLRAQGFLVPESLSNTEQAVPSPVDSLEGSADKVFPTPHVPLSQHQRLIVVGLSLLLLIPVTFKVQRFGQFLKIGLTRSEAREIGRRALEHRGVDSSRFRDVVYTRQTLDTIAAQYVLKYSGVPRLNELASEKVKVFFWVVRFYQPLQEEEYRIYIDPASGEVVFVEHDISENAAGANLDKSTAQQLAEGFLRQKGLALETLELKESNVEKRKARLDYDFVWESKVDRVREAAVRWEVEVKGDEVGGFSSFVKVPEEWQREREKSTTVDTVLAGIRTIAIALVAGWGLWTFVGRARHGLVRWTPVIGLSLTLVLLQVLNSLNGLVSLFEHYPTSQSPSVFITSWFSSFFISQIVQFLYFALLFGLASCLYPECWTILRKRNRSRLSGDALLLTVAIVAGIFGLSRISDMLIERFHSIALLPALGIPEGTDYLFPAFSLFLHALRSSLVYTCILGILSYVLQNVIQKPYVRALAFVLILASILPPDASTRGEWIFSLTNQFCLLAIVVIVIRLFARRNVLAYLLTFLLLGLCRSAYELLSQPSNFMQWNGAALLFLAALVMIKTAIETKSNRPVELRREA